MGGVIVQDGELGFTAGYTLEWGKLSHGAPGIRERTKKLKGAIPEKGWDELLSQMEQIPIVVPTSREEVYDMAYGLIRELGEGVREELAKVAYPADSMRILFESFTEGFFDTGCGRGDRRGAYIGMAKLFYTCGGFVANMAISIFPEEEDVAKPDFDVILQAFRLGLTGSKRGSYAPFPALEISG